VDKLYSCNEIAERYGVKVLTVYEWIKRKRLSALKIGKSYFISEEDIAQFEKKSRV
jgi:excisionase family DNA binding protein